MYRRRHVLKIEFFAFLSIRYPQDASWLDEVLYPVYSGWLYGPFRRRSAERSMVEQVWERRWKGVNMASSQWPIDESPGAAWTPLVKNKIISPPKHLLKRKAKIGFGRHSSIIFALSYAQLVTSDGHKVDSGPADVQLSDDYDVETSLRALPQEIAQLLCASSEWQVALQLTGRDPTKSNGPTPIKAASSNHVGSSKEERVSNYLSLQRRLFGATVTSLESKLWMQRMLANEITMHQQPSPFLIKHAAHASYRDNYNHREDKNYKISSSSVALACILEKYLQRMQWNKLVQNSNRKFNNLLSKDDDANLHRASRRLMNRGLKQPLLVSLLSEVLCEVFAPVEVVSPPSSIPASSNGGHQAIRKIRTVDIMSLDMGDAIAVESDVEAIIQPGGVPLNMEEVRLLLSNFHAWAVTHATLPSGVLNQAPKQSADGTGVFEDRYEDATSPRRRSLSSSDYALFAVSFADFSAWFDVAFAWHIYCQNPHSFNETEVVTLGKDLCECLPLLVRSVDDMDRSSLSTKESEELSWTRDRVASLLSLQPEARRRSNPLLFWVTDGMGLFQTHPSSPDNKRSAGTPRATMVRSERTVSVSTRHSPMIVSSPRAFLVGVPIDSSRSNGTQSAANDNDSDDLGTPRTPTTNTAQWWTLGLF